MTDMKQGWEECILEDYIKLIDYRGRTPVKTESGIRLITAKNVKLGYLQLEPQEFIAEDNYESWMTRGIPNFGDVIFTTEAPLANVAQIDTYDKVAFAQRIIVMQPQKDKIDSTFLKFLLLSDSTRRKILDKGTGATVLGIKSSLLKKIKISIPSIPEQQRIVSILDTAFEAIDKAKANAEQNLKNSKELFESYLQNIFSSKGEGWEEKTLGDLCNVIGGGTPSKANGKFYDGSIYWATVRDMKGDLITDTEHKITLDAVKNSSTNIIPKGNVVIATRVGLGRVCLIQNDTAINQDLRGVVPINLNKLSVDFLFRWFKSIANKIVEEGTGATVQGVKLPFIKSLIINVPPIQEQNNIVKKLESLSKETKRLEAIYQQKLIDLEELKKSLLEKAFKGELKTEKIEVV